MIALTLAALLGQLLPPGGVVAQPVSQPLQIEMNPPELDFLNTGIVDGGHNSFQFLYNTARNIFEVNDCGVNFGTTCQTQFQWNFMFNSQQTVTSQGLVEIAAGGLKNSAFQPESGAFAFSGNVAGTPNTIASAGTTIKNSGSNGDVLDFTDSSGSTLLGSFNTNGSLDMRRHLDTCMGGGSSECLVGSDTSGTAVSLSNSVGQATPFATTCTMSSGTCSVSVPGTGAGTMHCGCQDLSTGTVGLAPISAGSAACTVSSGSTHTAWVWCQ